MSGYAIPTEYRGARFRSRLEARWAAFFDLVGWRWDYEPFDLPGWIPDFALIGRKQTVLVEVKPIEEIDWAVARKIDQAAGGGHDLLLLGIRPMSRPLDVGGFCDADHHLGWLHERGGYSDEWGNAVLARWPAFRSGIGFFHGVGSYHDRIAGFGDGGHFMQVDPDEIQSLWNRAGAAVQWRKTALAEL